MLPEVAVNVVKVVVVEERMRRWRKELALLGATRESAERERERERGRETEEDRERERKREESRTA